MTTRPANPREKPRHGSPRVLFPFSSSLRNHRSSLSIVLSTFLKFWTPTEIVYLLEWKNLQFDLCVLVRNWTRRRNNLVKTRWFPEYLANKKIRKEWRTAIIRINWSDKVSRPLTRNSNERRSDVPKRGFILSPTSCEAFSCCVLFYLIFILSEFYLKTSFAKFLLLSIWIFRLRQRSKVVGDK